MGKVHIGTCSTSLNKLSYTVMLFTIMLSHSGKSTYWNMQHQSQQTVVYSDVIHYHTITWWEKYILEHAAPISTNCRIQWCYSLSCYHMVGKVHIGTCSTSLNKLSYTVMLFTIMLSHGGKSTYWNMQHQSQQTVVYSDVIHYHAKTVVWHKVDVWQCDDKSTYKYMLFLGIHNTSFIYTRKCRFSKVYVLRKTS